MRRLALVMALGVLMAACGGATGEVPRASSSSAASASAAPRVSLKINWTAVSGTSGALWVAYESGYFNDENLDVQLVNVPSSSRAVAALVANDAQFSHMDGQVALDAKLAGSDVKLVMGVNNRLVFSVMSKPDIKSPQELKGKTVGITSIGASTHTAALLALKQWNLSPSDVKFVTLTEVPSIFSALQAGQVDAGVMSPPTNTRAKAAGFYELVNLAKDGPEWPSVALAATAQYLAANPTVAGRVIRAYAHGMQRFKTDKTFAIGILKKYLKVDDQAILEDTWTQYSQYFPEVPYVLGMQTTIDTYGQSKPAVKSLKPEDVIDSSYVTKLDDEGFFKKLYGK